MNEMSGTDNNHEETQSKNTVDSNDTRNEYHQEIGINGEPNEIAAHDDHINDNSEGTSNLYTNQEKVMTELHGVLQSKKISEPNQAGEGT